MRAITTVRILAASALATAMLVRPASAQEFQLLYSFGNTGDGQTPEAGLLEVGKTFYGTTRSGGTSGDGTAFGVSETGEETMLYSFAGGSGDGAYPVAGLTRLGKTLYGVTEDGGAFSGGTAFSITEDGEETVLHDFGDGNDGDNPAGRLLKAGKALYGTTYAGGGSNDQGTVFTLTPAGAEDVIYAFNDNNDNDGFNPAAGLIKVHGELYGTTSGGGTYGWGTVFEISKTGNETIVYSFAGGTGDGADPLSGLLYVHGTLYGTTYQGGTDGHGTVFAVTLSGQEAVLHSFGGSGDGSDPDSGLVDLDGTLYGTTFDGGTGGKFGDGTIFSITPAGDETVEHSFTNGPDDGGFPQAGMIKSGNTLYGTTTEGGTYGEGTIFTFSPGTHATRR